MLLTKSILFVGYSLSDPDFRLLFDRQLTNFKGFVPERYALMRGVGKIECDVLWRTADIRILPYDEHDEIVVFVQLLQEALIAAPNIDKPGVNTVHNFRCRLHARCNADLSAEGLSALGCGNMDPEKVQKLDAVDQIGNLLKIGVSAGEKIRLEHFGPFAQQAATA